MGPVQLGVGEEQRLEALVGLGLLDTPAEERFDNLVALASIILDVPIALITLVDRDRQWFKARIGLDATQTDREVAFCSHAIESTSSDPFVVPDALLDPRFVDNPLVTGDPKIRFYAGQVLRDRGGLAMGTLCAIDRRPRDLTDAQRRALSLLAKMAEQQFERDVELDFVATLAASEHEKSLILDTLTEGLVWQDHVGRILQWNPAAERLLGVTSGELAGQTSIDPRGLAIRADGSRWPVESHPAMVALQTGQPVQDVVMGVEHSDGAQVWLRINSHPVTGPEGTPTRVLTAFADATAEIEARKRSEALSHRLRLAVQMSGVGTAILDETYRAIYANDAYHFIMGVAPEKTIGTAMSVLMRPNDRGDGRLELDELKSGSRGAFSNEVRLDLDGEPTRWILTHRTRLAPIDGQIAYMVQIEDVTALRRSEEKARVSLDALEQGVVLVAASGVIDRMNPAAERLLGYTAEELTLLWSSPEWIVFDEYGEVLPPKRRPILRALATGSDVIGEIVQWTRRDGRRITIRISCIANADGAGGIVIAFTDVTEEHRSRRLLDATLDTAPVGLAILDSARRIIRCNAMFAQHAGRLASELVGMDAVGLVHVDDRRNATTVARRLRTGSRSEDQLEQRVIRPDGSVIWVRTHLAVIADPDRPLAIAATFDVTQQRQMTQELTLMGYLFEHANDIITVIDAAGQVVNASPSSWRILGYPDGYRHPDGILGLVHPDDVAKAATEMASLIANTRGPEPFTVRVRSKTGEWRHLECIGVNLLDEPAVEGIVVTARDTTERERLTEQLAYRASHDTLTDLPNRSVLDGLISKALARAVGDQNHVGLCFIDLDGFKTVNDTLGHAAGDQLLVDIADRIRRLLRPGDAAARIGGDEFIILLEAVAGPTEALGVATRIRDALIDRDIAAEIEAATGARLGASVGLTISEPGDTPTTILGRADAALYRAKARHNSSIEISATVPG